MYMYPRPNAVTFMGKSFHPVSHAGKTYLATTLPAVDVPLEDIAWAFKAGWGPVFNSNGVPVT